MQYCVCLSYVISNNLNALYVCSKKVYVLAVLLLKSIILMKYTLYQHIILGLIEENMPEITTLICIHSPRSVCNIQDTTDIISPHCRLSFQDS